MKILTIIVALITTSSVYATTNSSNNEFSENVTIQARPIHPGDLYRHEFDTSKFRLSLLNQNYSSPERGLASTSGILNKLQSNLSSVCGAVKSASLHSIKNSSSYVVSAFKKAGVIDNEDKNYSLKSSHFLWELYLAYRDFIDISEPIKHSGQFSFSNLPQGAIVNVEKGCNENGAVAIYCDSKYYTPKFVDVEKLENRLNNPDDKNCKVGKGLRVVVESSRLRD